MKKIAFGICIGVFVSLSLTAGAYYGYFKDVPQGQWYTDAVEYLKDTGVVSGYPDGSFKPNNPVNRAELSLMLRNLMGYMGDPAAACEAPGRATEIGRTVFPTSNLYKGLGFLGELFTAADCGTDRIDKIYGVENNQYTLGSNLTFDAVPSQGLITAMKTIGFSCNSGAEAQCMNWKLSKTVGLDLILKLRSNATELTRKLLDVDCVNCG